MNEIYNINAALESDIELRPTEVYFASFNMAWSNEWTMQMVFSTKDEVLIKCSLQYIFIEATVCMAHSFDQAMLKHAKYTSLMATASFSFLLKS